MNFMTTDTLAYAAGILENEGVFFRARTPVIRLSMPGHAKAVLDLMVELFGGSVDSPKGGWHHWELKGEPAIQTLKTILPHLKIRQNLVTRLLAGAKKKETQSLLHEESVLPSPPIPGLNTLALRAGEQWVVPQRDLFSATGWEPLSGSWPALGTVEHGRILTASGTDWRKEEDGCSACSLASILEPTVAPKYYLSPKACKAILLRAERRGKEIPLALYQALETVANQEKAATEN